jgi:formylglycine-generating enzyme required for sulfatase activity
VRLNKDLVPQGVAALFSCKTGEFAYETDKRGKGHGVFFYHVIEGLKGRKAARQKEGNVTWNDLVDYASQKVTEDVPKVIGGGAKQTPHQFLNIAGTSPVVIPGVPQDREMTNSIGMKLVRIPAGRFIMGSPVDEKGRSKTEDEHEVRITDAFYMGAFEVTQKQFRTVMGYNPSWFRAGGKGQDDVRGQNTDDFPVENLDWFQAVDFCKKLAAMPGEKKHRRKYRLPTEAEWEYACRAGTATPFCSGNSLSSTGANFNGNYPYGGAAKGSNLERPCKVGGYKPNAWGLYDMHGNVYEWCSDYYEEDYYKRSRNPINPQGPDEPRKDALQVVRGGSWHGAGAQCRSAYRSKLRPGGKSRIQGIRVVLVLDND